MKFDFGGKTALVTGASRGIGKQIADDLEALSCKVIRLSKRDFDLSNLAAVEVGIREITANNNKIDILINNAGINIISNIEDTSFENFHRVMTVNLTAVFLINKAIIPLMKKHGYGRVLNVSSIYGSISKAGRLSYSASKHGLMGISKTMGIELAKHNILTNCISPGFTKTDLTMSVLSKQEVEELSAAIPIGRLATTKDISNAAVFLVSNLNTYITAQNIIVDGGHVNV